MLKVFQQRIVEKDKKYDDIIKNLIWKDHFGHAFIFISNSKEKIRKKLVFKKAERAYRQQ